MLELSKYGFDPSKIAVDLRLSLRISFLFFLFSSKVINMLSLILDDNSKKLTVTIQQ